MEDNKLKQHRDENLIEDGDTTKVRCSSCNKELVDIWIILPNSPIKTEITVECPHCGDKSFKYNIIGQYCLGHVESGITKMTSTETETIENADGSYIQKILVKTSK